MKIVLPLLVLAFILGILPISRDAASSSMPTYQTLQAGQAGEVFVAYARAVAAFQSKNTAYVGSVSQAQLATLGFQSTSSFFASAGNAITATSAAGRKITAYATLPSGSISSVATVSGGDATFGTSNGSTWTSIAPGSTAQALATAVPNGSVVSVVQIGQ